MTTLTINSSNQGFAYTECAAVQSFAVIERLAGFAGAVLQAVRSFKVGRTPLRAVQA
jgi:hypothetical protein